MPGMDGVEATLALVAKVPEARVLILTTFDLDEYAFAGLRPGPVGFCSRRAAEDLLSAVRSSPAAMRW